MIETLLELLPDAMAAVDGDGNLVAANAAFHTLFGSPVGALLGQPLSMLVPERLRARHEEHLHAWG